MRLKFFVFALSFVFTLSAENIYAALYFSPTNSTMSYTNIEVTNKSVIDINRSTEILKPQFELSETNSFLKMYDNKVIEQENITVSEYIPQAPYMTHPFRYTEVTFIITAAFAYTYASLATLAVYNLQNNFITQLPERGTYKTINMSTTIFQVFTGLSVATAVAYDSYQRVYGKKKNKDKQLSFNFIPFYDPPRKDAGFVFTLSYELGGKRGLIKNFDI